MRGIYKLAFTGLAAVFLIIAASYCSMQKDAHIPINSSIIEFDGEKLYDDLLAEIKPADNRLYMLSSLHGEVKCDGELDDLRINICAEKDGVRTKHYQTRGGPEITLINSGLRQRDEIDISALVELRPVLQGLAKLPWKEIMSEHTLGSPKLFSLYCEHYYTESWDTDMLQYGVSDGIVEEIGAKIPFNTARLMFRLAPLYETETEGCLSNDGIKNDLIFYVE